MQYFFIYNYFEYRFCSALRYVIHSYCNSYEYFLCSPYFNMWHVMHCYWIAQYVHNFGHYHIARKFGGTKLASWANRPWFAKLKLSKLVLTTKNLLADLLIPQTFFRQKLKKSQFAKLFPTKLSRYTVFSNIYTIDITYFYMCVCTYILSYKYQRAWEFKASL